MGPSPEDKSTVLASSKLLSEADQAASRSIVPNGEAFVSIIPEGHDKAPGQTLEDYISNLSHPRRNITAEEFRVNSQIVGIRERGEFGYAIHISNGPHVYAFLVPLANGEAHKSTVDLILSTFEFTR